MRRILIGALAGLLLAGGAPSTPTLARAEAPDSGLPSGTTVFRDLFGVVHIRASDRQSLYFTQGWAHARDRLFQMDLRRRQASGTLAELLGPAALGSDVELRTIGLRRAAERSLGALSPRARAALDAYSAGVNAFAAANPLPPEYGVLHLTRFEPWTPVDSVVIAKLIAFGLSFDLDVGPTVALLAYLEGGQAAGFDGARLFFEDLWRSQPFTPAASVPDAIGQGLVSTEAARSAQGAGTGSGERLRGLVQLAERYRARAARTPLLAEALRRDRTASGSNEWVVSGRHTTSGRPLLANDPHLGLEAPSQFYPIHLRSGELDVIGESFAGIPAVVVGNNRFISWGATTNPMDVTDTFRESVQADPTSPSGLAIVHRGLLEPILAIPEVFRQNNPASGRPDDVTVVPPGGPIPPATLIVPRRNNGPIVELDLAAGQALSVQYTGFSATRELDTFLVWNEARGLDDFRRGLETFDFGSQNWAYADVHGNVAYFTSAELPLREDLESGRVEGLPPFFIREGTGGNEWLPVRAVQPGQAVPYEILPAAEMPQTVNPPAGFVVNANNDPAGVTLDNDPLNQRRPTGGIFYLNPGYDGFRGGRITELLRAELAGGGRVSMDDMQRLQADTGLIDAAFFVPHLQRAFDSARRSSNPALAALAADPAVAEAASRLRGWDFSTPTGIREGYDASDVFGVRLPPRREEVESSVAATLYAVWRSELVRGVIDARLAPLGLPVPDGDLALTALKHLLETFDSSGGVGASGLSFFPEPAGASPAERRDLALLRALASGLARLAGPGFQAAFGGSRNQGDYRWGRLHRVVLEHPLGGQFNIPPGGGAFPAPLADLPGIPTDGGFGTVDAAGHGVRAASSGGFMFGGGPANRYVSEPGQYGVRAVTSIPGGVSGVPGSPYYVNLLPGWLTNETFPLLQH